MATEKILVLVPGPNARGGITNYYYSIRKDLPESVLYLQRGSRNWPKRGNIFQEAIRYITDYTRYIHHIRKKDVVLVQVTLPFAAKAMIRDSVYILLARLFKKKITVFIRGWIDEYVYNLSGVRLYLVKKVLFSADSIIELSQSNIDHLRKLGYTKKIFLETTLVDRSLLHGFDVENSIKSRLRNNSKKILFLSRLEKDKGIYTLLSVYKLIKNLHPEFELIIAGDGTEEKAVRKFIETNNLHEVTMTGFVKGEEKRKLFEEAGFFVFLSEHEGMPNAVLEAMSFGLPVFTTNVGGIATVFKDQLNGHLLNETNPATISTLITDLAYDAKRYSEISNNNYTTAQQKFLSNIVASRLMNIYKETLNDHQQ